MKHLVIIISFVLIGLHVYAEDGQGVFGSAFGVGDTVNLQNERSGTLQQDGTIIDSYGNVIGRLEGDVVIDGGEEASTSRRGVDNNTKPASPQSRAKWEACNSEHTKAKVACLTQQNTGNAASLLSTFQYQQSSGSIKEACETAKKIAGLSAAANLGFSFACKNAAQNCITQCTSADNDDTATRPPNSTPAEAMLYDCQGYKDTLAVSALSQGLASVQSFAGSQACIDASSGKCIGDNAYNDEECQQFCMKPGRQDHPKCRIAMNSCSDPQYASQNAQYCNCIRNPFSPQCGSNLGGLPSNALNGAPPLQDLEIPPGAYDYEGNNIQGSRSDFGSGNGGGGGGFNGSGGGSSALGGNEAQGNGDDPIDKNILSGASGGGGMVGGFGGGGYNEGGGGGNKAGGLKDPDGIDLKAFLPGGKKDPKRSPASAYGDASITPANGLTNFQKVTKKFLEKIQNGELRP